MAFAIARMAKQKGGSVGSSSLHNGRLRETPNADPAREKENRIILGLDRSTPEMVRETIDAHGGKPRRDSVEAVEVLLTASPEWWLDDNDEIDRKKVDQFSAAAREFLSKQKNGGICVKAILHMDEHSPHIHAHLVPIDPNGKLNCKHYFGTREKLSRWQDSFAEQVKSLGLERGVVNSRARHIDIKDFYKAIERDHRIRINHERLPDPPKMCVTKESAQKFKEEFTKALTEQIQEPIGIQLHQAMLARDSHNKLKETKRRLAQTREEVSRQQLIVQDLQQENEQMRHQLHDLIQRAEKAEARVQDVDHGAVMRMLGYKVVPGQQRGVTDFMKTDKNQLISVFPGAVYDGQGQMVARSSVALIQEVMRREGQQISRADAVGWLADHCGDERAKAASLVEREQATEDFLHERRKERERSNLTPARDETLSRPEIERIHDRVIDRNGRNHDFGLTR
jgi:hypothetical protein